MRVKSEIWTSAYIRHCQSQGLFAAVCRRGDNDAGAIYIKINTLDGLAYLYTPAPTGFSEDSYDRMWLAHEEGIKLSERDVDQYLQTQSLSDPDMWIIELEDKQGRHFLEDAIYKF